MKRKMPQLTWRTRKRLKTALTVLGCTLAVLAVAWVCWILWLGRFVVYARDGVRLDFDWKVPGSYQEALPPEEREIHIVYDDGIEAVVVKSKELTQLGGYVITTDMLTGDVADLDRRIRELPKGTPILLELKNGKGSFFYDTDLPDAPVSSKVDLDAMEELLEYLAKADYYTIASVPAFRDRSYGLENTAYGILHSSGGYLWAGSDKCYWLDPAKNGTRSRLVDIAAELRDLGFDEVVFTDFCFPPTEDIRYEDDKIAVLNDTAEHLVRNLVTEDFCVSFLTDAEGFRLPEGRTRLYRSGVDASMAQSVAETLFLPNPQINLVFLTEVYDTRFDAFGVLRPLPLDVTQLPAVTEPTEPTEPSDQTEEPAQAE